MTHDDAGSAPMLGSQEPAAWAAFEEESGESGVTALNREAVEEVAARMGWQVAALYRAPQPTLTDEEREALEMACRIASMQWFSEVATRLRGLLKRLG